MRANIKAMIAKKITLHGRHEDLLHLKSSPTMGPHAFLSFQLKTLQNLLRKQEPLGFSVKTMQQCTAQQARLQQLLSSFVDFIHASVLKPYAQLFLASDERRPAELVLSAWLRSDAAETTMAPALALYLCNDLIQFKLVDNIKLIMRILGTLNSANVNVQSVVEKAIGPVTLLAMDKLLGERIANLVQSKKDGEGLDALYVIEGYRLLSRKELEENKAEDTF